MIEPRDAPKVSERNTVDVISLMAIILVYSAMKIKANKPLLYSTLNPETSSDSPSAKSKGVRLVSARLVINQRIPIIGISKATGVDCPKDIMVKSIVFRSISAQIKIKVILTS